MADNKLNLKPAITALEPSLSCWGCENGARCSCMRRAEDYINIVLPHIRAELVKLLEADPQGTSDMGYIIANEKAINIVNGDPT